MTKFYPLTAVMAAIILTVAPQAEGAQKQITGTFATSPGAGTKVVAVANDGKAATAKLSGKNFSITPTSSTARLYLLKSGRITGQVVLSKCTGTPTQPKGCSTKQVYTQFKAGSNLGTLVKSGKAFVKKSTSLSPVITSSRVSATSYVPKGLGNLGLGAATSQQTLRAMAALATGPDADSDGLVNPLDIDDDGDGIIDNYDLSTPAELQNSFRVFSNLKLDIEASLNHYTTGLSDTAMQQALEQAQTLAIEVAGSGSETTELDCGTLTYCSEGGTGEALASSAPFPGAKGGSFDPDSDGYGTITKGPTGDFQLQTRPTTTTSVSGGDTFIERVTSSSGAGRQVPGVLNFAFSSTPGLRSFAVNGGAEQVVDYTVTPVLGSRNGDNCVAVPATGEVEVTISGYRPQRPGIATRGEATYMNIANSLITIDIPNGPGSGGTAGPGNCNAGYSTTDSNLVSTGTDLRDGITRDYAVVAGTDDANRFTFTINLTDCLAAASTPVTWSSGEKLSIDVQFRSSDGDNAATKFCLERE